jgi:hypothetical protein
MVSVPRKHSHHLQNERNNGTKRRRSNSHFRHSQSAVLMLLGTRSRMYSSFDISIPHKSTRQQPRKKNHIDSSPPFSYLLSFTWNDSSSSCYTHIRSLFSIWSIHERLLISKNSLLSILQQSLDKTIQLHNRSAIQLRTQP